MGSESGLGPRGVRLRLRLRLRLRRRLRFRVGVRLRFRLRVVVEALEHLPRLDELGARAHVHELREVVLQPRRALGHRSVATVPAPLSHVHGACRVVGVGCSTEEVTELRAHLGGRTTGGWTDGRRQGM